LEVKELAINQSINYTVFADYRRACSDTGRTGSYSEETTAAVMSFMTVVYAADGRELLSSKPKGLF